MEKKVEYKYDHRKLKVSLFSHFWWFLFYF